MDGRTDMVVTTFWYDFDIWVIMDNGDNTFRLIKVNREAFSRCAIAKPILLNQSLIPVLLVYRSRQEYDTDAKNLFRMKEVEHIDTLVYQSGDLIELNRNPGHTGIDSIMFRTSGCLGACPIFRMLIYKNRKAGYAAYAYNPTKGVFTAVLTKKYFDEIDQLISYLDIKKLKNDYQVTWTDDQTCWLKVNFSDGSVKEIQDYGMLGTYGLNRLYKMITELRTTEDWK